MTIVVIIYLGCIWSGALIGAAIGHVGLLILKGTTTKLHSTPTEE